MDRHRPHISFVLATHNRSEVLRGTLAGIARCGLDPDAYEVVVVDNASTDGTSGVIAAAGATALRLRRNAGSCAKALGVDRARGEFVVFLDDDSFPRPGSVARMIAHFEADERLGAAGFQVHLPDGRREGGALPDVFLGCGVGFRAEALRHCGGLDRTFFMQAEEYELAFRLIGCGWDVRTFDDLHVEHLKTTYARRTQRTTYFDIRNNLRVIARYLPPSYHNVYRADCLQRYAWLARRDGHHGAYRRGALAGRLISGFERRGYVRRRLDATALERFYRWRYTESRMAELAADGVRRLVFADLGKNVYAFHRAARTSGIRVAAIGDDRFAAVARHYRGTLIVPLEQALRVGADAVVVANSSAVHGTDTFRRVSDMTGLPVHHWFGPGVDPVLARVERIDSVPAVNVKEPEPATAGVI